MIDFVDTNNDKTYCLLLFINIELSYKTVIA